MFLNLERTRKLMAEQNLDALVASSPENVTYASGFANWTIYAFNDLEMYVVIPREGDLSLIAAIDASDYLAQCPTGAARTYVYGTFHTERRPDVELVGAEAQLVAVRNGAIQQSTAQAALRQALSDSGISGGRIGLDERGKTPARWNELLASLKGYQIHEAGDLFRQIRMIKTEAEIEKLRFVVQVVEQGMQAAFDRAVPGASEWDLEAEFRAVVAATGVTPGHFETSAGTRSAGCFPSSREYHIRGGDVIRSDAGGRYQGYWADTGRTIAIGDPPPALIHSYDALAAGIDAICQLIKPGAPIDSLFDTGVQTVRENGIPHYQRHHVGHAIGLEIYEAPVLVGHGGSSEIHRFETTDLRLEEGMVINIELPYYELGLGGLQLEETLVVRDGGFELLTTASRDLKTKAWAPSA
jgi:Xaa-Pro dipeptidase